MAELRDSYDAVVVGAGMGGLTCGGLLARQSNSVLVCEQHIRPGGCVCGFQRKGFTFDAVHFLISQCSPGETLPAALEEIGAKDAIEFLQVEQRTRIILPDLDFMFTPDTLVSELTHLFPAEARAIEQFAAEMTALVDEAIRYAQEFIDSYLPGAKTEEPDRFYGYYTLHILRDGQIYGMLSVNGYTGQVWYHSWHGRFLGMEEFVEH